MEPPGPEPALPARLLARAADRQIREADPRLRLLRDDGHRYPQRLDLARQVTPQPDGPARGQGRDEHVVEGVLRERLLDRAEGVTGNDTAVDVSGAPRLAAGGAAQGR